MLYVDYNFDIAQNIMMFDEELTLDKLPGWKEGDVFKLIIGATGRVTLIKTTEQSSNI